MSHVTKPSVLICNQLGTCEPSFISIFQVTPGSIVPIPSLGFTVALNLSFNWPDEPMILSLFSCTVVSVNSTSPTKA